MPHELRSCKIWRSFLAAMQTRTESSDGGFSPTKLAEVTLMLNRKQADMVAKGKIYRRKILLSLISLKSN